MLHTHGITAQSSPTAESPALRGTGFGLLFAGAAASKTGTEVSRVALPLTAVLALHASPGVVGLLGMVSTVAFLVIGLPTGVWVDRVRRRGIMVAADAARAVLLVSVPVAWWLGWLSLAQLFVVAALVGVATVFFDVSDHSYLPFLVGREGLVSANARLGGLNAVGAVAGPSVGGYLVAWLTAPAALLVEAASYLWSAAFIGAIRRREPIPEPAAGSSMLGQIREGLAHVFRHPTFRFLLTGSVAVGAGIAALLGQYVAVRASLWVGGAGLALVWIPIFFSPLRSNGAYRDPGVGA